MLPTIFQFLQLQNIRRSFVGLAAKVLQRKLDPNELLFNACDSLGIAFSDISLSRAH